MCVYFIKSHVNIIIQILDLSSYAKCQGQRSLLEFHFYYFPMQMLESYLSNFSSNVYIYLNNIAMKAEHSLNSGMKKITQDFYVDKTKQLGKGNFGVVYKGYHLSTNRIIAVKFVQKRMLKNFPDYQREIMVMHDLAKINHPNIMGYYGYEDNEEGLYCFIEFCSGGSLKDIIKSHISELKILTLLKQFLDAMTYINGENKVHRDLKPDNILLDQNEELKIADFGLARDVQAKMTKGVCTPLYAAPEVLTLQPYNEKCDVWSAGLILYEMLTGKEMFAHVKKKAELMKQVASFAREDHKMKIPNSLHAEWQHIISKMMTHNPAKRPTFKEMKEHFEKLEPKIRNDLIAKYGYETPEYGEFDSELRVTKSISPYQSNPKKQKNNLADMAQRLKEERSFTYINNSRKYIHFYRLKAQIMVKLIKEFNSSQYPCMKNVYKYILMFLSVSGYISRLTSLLKEIQNKKILTPDGLVSKEEVLDTHQEQFQELMKQSAGKLETSINKYKSVLEKQIIVKIMGTYMQRAEEKSIIQNCGNLYNIITSAKQNKYFDEDTYMSLFKKEIQKEGIHFSMNIVRQFKAEDVKVYMYMRLIAGLDEILRNTFYKNDDYLRSKKQQFQNANKDQNLEFIQKNN